MRGDRTLSDAGRDETAWPGENSVFQNYWAADEFDEAGPSGVDLHGSTVKSCSTISTTDLKEDFHNRRFEIHAQENLARTMSSETYGRIGKTVLECGQETSSAEFAGPTRAIQINNGPILLQASADLFDLIKDQIGETSFKSSTCKDALWPGKALSSRAYQVAPHQGLDWAHSQDRLEAGLKYKWRIEYSI